MTRVFLGVLASWRLAAGQGGDWVTLPARPTVGDTIWIARLVEAPPGWRVRAGRLEAGGGGGGSGSEIEPLADPEVLRAERGGGWLVRYAVVAWAPGSQTVMLPPLWKLGPDGATDSVPGGTVTLVLASVIPDTVAGPEPRPSLPPLRSDRRDPRPAALAVLLSAGVLAGALAWRRRPPRPTPTDPPVPVEREAPEAVDRRWLAVGEPKAVAARAAGVLRVAIARAVPGAHEGLDTDECLTTLERLRPDAPIRELGTVLRALDQVAFAAAHGGEVGGLATRARRLAEDLRG